MKKVIAGVLSLAMVAALATGCNGGSSDPTTTESESGNNGGGDDPVVTETEPSEDDGIEKTELTIGTGSEVINLWSFTNEIPNMVSQYVTQNPDFGSKYTVKVTIIATDGGAYQQALDAALVAGGDSAPDMYAAEAAASSSIHRVIWLDSQLHISHSVLM